MGKLKENNVGGCYFPLALLQFHYYQHVVVEVSNKNSVWWLFNMLQKL